MSLSERKTPEIEPDYKQAIKEHSEAERKVAEGVSRLYAYCRSSKNPEPDEEQKIATVTISAKEAEEEGLSQYFPNKLCNGITVHFYEPGYVRHPPLRYMVSQKMKSLCDAAKIAYGVNQFVNIAAHADSVIKSEYKKFRRKLATKWKKINKNKKYSKEEKKIAYQKLKDNEFNKMSQNVMKICSGYALDTLHKSYGAKKIDREEFSKTVLKESAHHRSNDSDTLTFNEETNMFSYDGLAYFSNSGEPVKSMEPVTAHDKRIGRRCANLSTVFDGKLITHSKLDKDKRQLGYTPSATVTSSIVKHSSLAPDSDIGYFNSLTSSEKKIKLLMQTANNAEDALLAHVNLRRHGQDEKNASKTMHVDWNYELLTTNAGNSAKEATNFGYAAQAIGLMSGGTYKVGDLEVKADISLSNIGINKYGAFNFLNKRNLQPDENRKARIHQNEVLRKSDFKDLPLKLQQLKDLIAPNIIEPKYQNLLNEYEEIKKKLAENANNFNQVRKEYNKDYKNIADDIKKAESMIKHYKQMPHSLPTRTEIKRWKDFLERKKQQKNTIEARCRGCIERSKKLQNELSDITKKMEKIQEKHWEKNLANVNQIIADLRKNPSKLKDMDNRSMALVFKVYMDNLYYSGKHRGKFTRWLRYDSKNATLYNAYSAAYNRIMGIETSIGCKSANDRTYVMRLFIAAVNDLSQQPDMVKTAKPKTEVKSSDSLQPNDILLDLKDEPENKMQPTRVSLPANYHNPADTKAYDRLMGWISNNMMSNSATHSCINDTGGGASKVSSKQFYFLEKLRNINFFKKFGKWAQHTMKKSLNEAFTAYNATTLKQPGRFKKLLGNLFSKPKPKPIVVPAINNSSLSEEQKSAEPPPSPRPRP